VRKHCWALIEKARCRWALGDVKDADRDFQRAEDHADSLGARLEKARILLLLSAMLFEQSPEASHRWFAEAFDSIRSGGYWFLLEAERSVVFPMPAHFAAASDQEAARSAAEMLRQLEKLPPPPLQIVTLGALQMPQDLVHHAHLGYGGRLRMKALPRRSRR